MKEYGHELITSQNTPFIEQFHKNAAQNAYDRPSSKENNKDQKQRDPSPFIKVPTGNLSIMSHPLLRHSNRTPPWVLHVLCDLMTPFISLTPARRCGVWPPGLSLRLGRAYAILGGFATPWLFQTQVHYGALCRDVPRSLSLIYHIEPRFKGSSSSCFCILEIVLLVQE